MNKKILNGVITALVTSNVIVGYQFAVKYGEQSDYINEQETTIQSLLNSNIERNSLIEKQQEIIYTYEDEVLKLNNQIEVVKKELSESRKKEAKSP